MPKQPQTETDFAWEEIFALDSLAIIGLSKNAGKTTVLNHLIAAWRRSPSTSKRCLALSSIGRDGEDRDVVTQGVKPRIYLAANSLIATATLSLSRSDALLDLRAASGIYTAYGEVMLCRALSDGYVELSGPAQAGDLLALEQLCRQEQANCFFVVDGALSRRSPAGSKLTQAAFLVAGAESAPSLENLAAKLNLQLKLLQCPALEDELAAPLCAALAAAPQARLLCSHASGQSWRSLNLDSNLGQEEKIAAFLKAEDSQIFLKGALTSALWRKLSLCLPRQGLLLIVEDGTKVFLNEADLQRLESKQVQLRVLNPLDIRGVFFNPADGRGHSLPQPAALEYLRTHCSRAIWDLGPALV